MKKEKILKIIVIMSCFVILGLLGTNFYLEMTNKNVPFFIEHFAKPISLLLIGVDAILLPRIPQNTLLGGSNKGDKIMPYIGIGLIVCAVILLVVSF